MKANATTRAEMTFVKANDSLSCGTLCRENNEVL